MKKSIGYILLGLAGIGGAIAIALKLKKPSSTPKSDKDTPKKQAGKDVTVTTIVKSPEKKSTVSEAATSSSVTSTVKKKPKTVKSKAGMKQLPTAKESATKFTPSAVLIDQVKAAIPNANPSTPTSTETTINITKVEPKGTQVSVDVTVNTPKLPQPKAPVQPVLNLKNVEIRSLMAVIASRNAANKSNDTVAFKRYEAVLDKSAAQHKLSRDTFNMLLAKLISNVAKTEAEAANKIAKKDLDTIFKILEARNVANKKKDQKAYTSASAQLTVLAAKYDTSIDALARLYVAEMQKVELAKKASVPKKITSTVPSTVQKTVVKSSTSTLTTPGTPGSVVARKDTSQPGAVAAKQVKTSDAHDGTPTYTITYGAAVVKSTQPNIPTPIDPTALSKIATKAGI